MSTLGLLLSGCGIGSPASSDVLAMAPITGSVHGGPNPIKNGVVTIWETQVHTNTGTGDSVATSGYGTQAKSLATAVTDGYGNFTIANTTTQQYTCDSGQYAYVTVTGGNTGSYAENPNSVLMAAIGNCSNLSSQTAQSATRLSISEVSTAAAAYALGNFMTVNGTTGSQNVWVNAPANNGGMTATNTVITTPSCSGTGNSMSCSANGLAHAFANAVNLVAAVNFSSTVPTGKALAAAASNADSVVPLQVLNLLGNIQQACVNTVGGTAGDSTPCGKLFTYTTPPGTYGSSTTPVAPTDTLSAMMNIAKFPTNNVTNLTNLSSPNSFFNPAMSSVTDLSLGVIYKGTKISATTTSFGYPWGLALDAADNVYVIYTDVKSATKAGLSSLKSDGTSIYGGVTQTTYLTPRGIALDNLGNVWMSNNTASGSSPGLVQYTASSGAYAAYKASGSYPWGIAVDSNNNLWYTEVAPNATNLFEMSASSSYAIQTFPTPPSQTLGPYGLGVDNNQNIWTANDYASSATTSAIGLFPNTGTVSTPAYTGAINQSTLASGTGSYGGVAFGTGGIAWRANLTGLYGATETVDPMSGNVTVSVANPVSWSAAGEAHPPATDGIGSVYTPIYYASAVSPLVQYIPSLTPTGSSTAGYTATLNPCYNSSATATVCLGTTSGAFYKPQAAQVDSDGSIWIINASSGYLVQLIGTASPTWPLLSYGHSASVPQ